MSQDTLETKFCWHELVSMNPQEDIDFYTHVFGWDTTPQEGPESYTCFLKSDGAGHAEELAGVMPLSLLPEDAKEGMTSMWLSYVQVKDVASCVSIAKTHGGSVCQEPDDVQGVGTVAVIKDKNGAMIGLLTPSEGT